MCFLRNINYAYIIIICSRKQHFFHTEYLEYSLAHAQREDASFSHKNAVLRHFMKIKYSFPSGEGGFCISSSTFKQFKPGNNFATLKRPELGVAAIFRANSTTAGGSFSFTLNPYREHNYRECFHSVPPLLNYSVRYCNYYL